MSDFLMFSNFSNLFITAPRHAETTDTRLGIRKHEPEQEDRRRKNENDAAEIDATTDDTATVTVEALRVFLENFLKSFEAKKTDGANGAFSNAEPTQYTEQKPQAAVDGEAAKAASVYQHVAQKVDKSAAPVMSEEAQPANIIAAEDVRAIHSLLQDLKPLSERGVEYLTIERSDSFLSSLINAVEKAKQS